MAKYLSRRIKKTPQTGITSDRYQFLGLAQAEPDLGDPIVGPSSFIANPLPIDGNQYVLASYDNQPGSRYWVPAPNIQKIELVPGSFTVFNNGVQVGLSNSFDKFNFVGVAVTVDPVGVNPDSQTGIATVRIQVIDVIAPGDPYEIPFHDPVSGFLRGATDFVFRDDNVGIGTSQPNSKLEVIGNIFVSGVVSATTFVGNLTGTSTTATNVIGGIASVSQLYVTGISTLGTVEISSGIITATSGIVTYYGNLIGTAEYATYADNAGIATYADNAGISTNIKGGSAGNVVYQSAPDTTTFVDNSSATENQVLLWNGSSPVWSDVTTGSLVGTVEYANNAGIATNVIGGIASVTSLNVTGIATLTDIVGTSLSISGISTFVGAITGTISTATKLETPRTFEITGDVVASPIFFDGTGNVSLAATIQPDSVGLGTDTFGDYVKDITGTANQITVTGGIGEGSTPILSIPTQFTTPQDVTVSRDLQVNRNLSVNGNITIGGTSATLFTETFKVADADIVLGVRTDGNGNDISTDNTANHGGIAIASTEGNPLVILTNPGVGETLPATYKKIMWFKEGSFAGLGTDAWLSNYAIGIGSTQFPSGTRLAAGSVQFSENDLTVVRNINASGIVTASTFEGTLIGYASSAGIATNIKGGSAGNVVYQSAPDTTTFVDNSSATENQVLLWNGSSPVWSDVTTGSLVGTVEYANNAGIATYAINAGIATYADIAGIATYANNAGISTYADNAGISTYADIAGIATYATNAGIATYADNAGIATYATNAGIATYADNAGISTNIKGGSAGNVVYQSAPDTTTFVDNSSATENQVLLWNGSSPVWSDVTTGSLVGTVEYANNAGIATNVIGGIASVTSLNVTGISTLGTVEISSGIITATTGIVTYYGDGSKLTDVVSASGYADFSGISTNIKGGSAGNVVYQSAPDTTTFVDNSSATENQVLLWNGSSPVWSDVNTDSLVGTVEYAISAGIATYADNAGISTYADIAGIATLAQGLTGTPNITVGGVTASFINVSGVGATQYSVNIVGDTEIVGTLYVDNIGIGTTNPTQRLDIAGSVKIDGGLYDSNNSRGNLNEVLVSTGSGIGVTWKSLTAGDVAGAVEISSSSPATPYYIIGTEDATGVTSSFYSNVDIVYTGDGRLGIGTTNPQVKLDVDGDGYFTGIVSASAFIGTASTASFATTATNVIGGTGSITSLTVSGITTLGSVQISPTGIITSSNPGVTTVVYYGDGSNLEGVTAFNVDTEVNSSEPVYPTLASGVGVNRVGISTTKLVFVESTASLGIGTTNPISNLHIVGNVFCTGIITATDFNSASDAKLKTNIQPIENPLEKVSQINGVSFNWIKNNKPSIGVIADELQNILPELVSDTDPKTVNYNGLIGLLIECVKQQQEEINTLKDFINNNN
jgi:hypothetical protein